MNFDYMKMIKPVLNVGEREQRIRLLTGTVLVFISIFTAYIILLLAGLILIATGYFGRCPAYAAINHSTLDNGGTDSAKPVTAASTVKAEPKAKPAAKKPAKKTSTATKAKTATKKTATASKAKTTAKKTTTKAKSTAKK